MNDMMDTLVKMLMDYILVYRTMYLSMDIMFQTYDVMDKLAKVQGDEGRQALYDKHTKQVLESFQDSYPVWTNHSSDRLVFDMLLMEAGIYLVYVSTGLFKKFLIFVTFCP